jgi:hypothetical protein
MVQPNAFLFFFCLLKRRSSCWAINRRADNLPSAQHSVGSCQSVFFLGAFGFDFVSGKVVFEDVIEILLPARRAVDVLYGKAFKGDFQ